MRSCFALSYGSKIICLGGTEGCVPDDARGLRHKREEAAAYMRNKTTAGSKKKASKTKATPQWLPDNPILEPGYGEKFEAAVQARLTLTLTLTLTPTLASPNPNPNPDPNRTLTLTLGTRART